MMAALKFQLMVVKHGLQPALPIAQFYHVTADNRVPFHVAGRNSRYRNCARSKPDTLTNAEFEPANGMALEVVKQDGLFRIGPIQILFMPVNMVASLHVTIIARGRHNILESIPTCRSVMEPKDMKYRFQWTAPIQFHHIIQKSFIMAEIFCSAQKMADKHGSN